MAKNVNPLLLSNCVRNNICTQISCQAMGLLSIELDAVSITLDVCKNNTPPGVVVELLKDGSAVFNRLITTSTKINYSKVGTATIEANIFLNSTNSSIGISVNKYLECLYDLYGYFFPMQVDPVTISRQSFISGSNSVSSTLFNYTLVPFNTSYCYIGKYRHIIFMISYCA